MPYERAAQHLGAVLRAGARARRFILKRQKGSHVVMRRDDPFAQVVIPDHRELDRGTLRTIIRAAGLSVDEFKAFL